MRLTLTQFVTLDGVYQGPGSPDEDTTDGFTRGGWMVPHMDQTFIAIAAGWLEQAGALLLGRRTYEAFAHGVAAEHRPRRPVRRTDELAAQVRRVAHDHRDAVDAGHRPRRRRRRPGRRAQGAARRRVAGARIGAARAVAAGRRPDRRDPSRHQPDRPRPGPPPLRRRRARPRHPRRRARHHARRPHDPGVRVDRSRRVRHLRRRRSVDA